MDGAATRAETDYGVDVREEIKPQDKIMVELWHHNSRHDAELDGLSMLSTCREICMPLRFCLKCYKSSAFRFQSVGHA